MPKKVLFFGIYDKKYSRTRVLQNGFTRNGWIVEECHIDPRKNRNVLKYVKLAWLGFKARRTKHDLVIVGFPAHTVTWLARLIFGHDIVVDVFLSLYDTNVVDRKLYTGASLQGRKDKFLDRWCCVLARNVLVDTKTLGAYFAEFVGVPREKIIPVPIGADDAIFFPSNQSEDEMFTVHFHGTFIPLQGVSHIVEAAHILRDEDVRFRIIGSGQDAPRVDKQIAELGLTNVERIPKVPVEQIPGYLARAHIVLGIFGDAERGKRAVTNKVYEAMAMGKAIITMDCKGMRELPDPEKAFVLVPAADPQSIVAAVLALRQDDLRRRELGRNARAMFENFFLPERIVENLLAEL